MKHAISPSDRSSRPEQPARECPFSPQVSAYHDGELPVAERQELERHMVLCPSCAEELGHLRCLSKLLAQAPSPALPDGFVDRLRAGVDSAREQVIVHTVWPALAAAALLLIAFSLVLWQTRGARAEPAEKGELWEIAVTSLHARAPAEAGPEELLTQLIVGGLSREAAYEQE